MHNDSTIKFRLKGMPAWEERELLPLL